MLPAALPSKAGHPVSVCPGTPGMNNGSLPSPAFLESGSPRALSESSATPLLTQTAVPGPCDSAQHQGTEMTLRF